MNATIDTQARQIFAALVLMTLVATGLIALGEFFLTRHEVYMVIAGIGIGAVAAVASLFLPR